MSTSKAAIVFGGSTGIGLASASLLADRGVGVSIVSHDGASLAALAANDRLHAIKADVSVDGDVSRAVEESVEHFGGLDYVVFSAGIQRYGSVISSSEAQWDEVMAVNLKGAYLACHHALPKLVARGGGAVVIVSSVQAIACQNNVAAYAASKGGLNALTRAMALDHAGQRIRVNCVCPGSVDTPMLRESARLFSAGRTEESVMTEWGSNHALGRVASAHEIASVVAFLLGDEASFMTGAEVRVDGGLTAGLAVKTAMR